MLPGPRLAYVFTSFPKQPINHLESVPIFNQRLEIGIALRVEPFSLAF